MQLNYIGRFALIKHLIPLLLSSPNGAKAIVDITSLASHFTTEGVGALGFNISAPATNRLTEAVATTYGPEGAFAYAVHPGAVRTSPPPGMPKDVLELLTDDPGLCGAFLVWLVKKERGWLNGRYVSANWDGAELESRRDEIVEKDMLKWKMVI